MEREDDDRKLSFSYDIGEEKLGLIDVSNEDDLLIDSRLFNSLEDLRLSVSSDSTNEDEAIKLLELQRSEGDNTEHTILQKEQNLSPSGPVESKRPSYLRKSLAWDSAFFNSAGVLDPDELTFINRGLKAVEDIRMRRAETRSTVNSSRKIDIGHQNKIKTKPASKRHRIRRSEKTKIERNSGRGEAPLKSPKTSDQMKNLLRGQSISASLNAHDVEIDNKSVVRSGTDMMQCEKSASVNSCSLLSGYLLPPTFSSVFSISTNDKLVSSSSYDTSLTGSSPKVPSAFVKGKTESRKSKFCASTSTSGTPRLPKRSKESGHPAFSIPSKSISNNFTCISPANSSDETFSKSISRSKQQPNDLEALFETSVAWRTGLQSGVLQGPKTPNIPHRRSSLSLQCEEIKSPAQVSTEVLECTRSISTEPRKKFKPSDLRQPSPKIGFFDEEKTVLTTTNGRLHIQCDMESSPPYAYGSINRKRPAKLLPDKTSPKTIKHSRESHLLHSAPGIKRQNASSDKKLCSSSPRVSSAMKSWSDVAWRLHTHKCVATEKEICSKSRKVDARECDRKSVGQTSDLKGDGQRRVKGRLKKRLGMENKGQKDDMRIQRELRNQSMEEKNAIRQTIVDNLHLLDKDKTRTSTNWEDQVNDLSRDFDVIDLNEDILMEFKGNRDPACSQDTDSIQNHIDVISPTFGRKNILDGQQQDLPNISPFPSQPSLSINDILPSSRTPLADKTSIFNRNGSFKSLLESTKGKLMAKASAISSFEGIDKGNI